MDILKNMILSTRATLLKFVTTYMIAKGCIACNDLHLKLMSKYIDAYDIFSIPFKLSKMVILIQIEYILPLAQSLFINYLCVHYLNSIVNVLHF